MFMKTVLTALVLVLLVGGTALAQRTTAVTDYFNVPTAEVLGAGQLAIAANSSNQVFDIPASAGYVLDLGLGNGLDVFASGDTDPLSLDNVVGGAKWVAGPRTAENSAQLALLLYNIGEGRTGIPGLTVTLKSPKVNWLSVSTAGWYVDGGWQGGAGATAYLNDNINLQAEYSSTGKLAYGVGLSYKNLFAELRKLDETDSFYGMAGFKLGL
jgi:hypothetical protein